MSKFQQSPPSSLHGKTHTHSRQQTNDDARDELNNLIGNFSNRKLRQIPAKQARESHSKEDAQYFNQYISRKDSASDPALKIGFPVFLENRQNSCCEAENDDGNSKNRRGYGNFP